MVDALRSVHRVLRTGGVLVDVRPSTSRVPRLERDGRVIARLVPTDHTRHRSALAEHDGHPRQRPKVGGVADTNSRNIG